MTSLRELNLRHLTSWYLDVDQKARTASEVIKKYYTDGAGIRWLIDRERAGSISESEDIRLHASVDDLLQFYSLVELACLIRFVPAPLPKWFADRALPDLTQSDIVGYYEEEMPMLLPQQLRLRLLEKHHLADGDVEHAASIFTQIICLNNMISNDSDVNVFRKVIGPHGYNGCSEDDLLGAIRDPRKFFEYLQVDPCDQRPLERALHGVSKFIPFCRDFDTFLCSIDYAPLFRAGAWHYHGYWFDYRSASIARMFGSVQESLEKQVALSDTEGLAALEEAIADISAMSKRLLEGPQQEVLRNAARNAYTVDGESHHGIDPAKSGVSGFGWYHELLRRSDQKFGGIFKGPVGVAAMLALPLLVFWLLLSVIGGWHGILAFLLAIVILLYCLGPDDLGAKVGTLIAAIRQGNDAEANRLAQALGHLNEPVSVETRGRTVVESILTEFQERFGVLLWFLILGPIGAVLFRFSAELRRYALQASSGLRDWAGRVYNVLAWLPSRIVALGYALSGNSTGAFENWRVLDTLILEQNETALRQSGTGALQVGSDAGEAERITAAQGLVTRTLTVLLAILTVLYVIAWIT